MVDRKEIRYGNVFMNKLPTFHKGKPVYVRINQLNLLSDSNDVALKNLEPIMITPQIISESGFETIDTGKLVGWQHPQLPMLTLCYLTDTHQLVFRVYIERSGIEIGLPFRYFHQLQNYFFLLTGSELSTEFDKD